jgi:hypothetical protein
LTNAAAPRTSTTTTRRKKSKRLQLQTKYVSELYVGHRLILGLKEHDRRSGEDTNFERQSHETVSPL